MENLPETLYKAFDGKAPGLSQFLKQICAMVINGVLTEFEALDALRYYDEFLDTPLSLEMLVPYDGSVMGKPEITDYPIERFYEQNGMIEKSGYDHKAFEEDTKAYQQAKERVLFNGFEVKHNPVSDIAFTNDFEWFGGKDNCLYKGGVGRFETISDMVGQPITENYFKNIID